MEVLVERLFGRFRSLGPIAVPVLQHFDNH